MWTHVGISRNDEGLAKATDLIGDLKKEFWSEVRVPGGADEFNPELEKAGRIADFYRSRRAHGPRRAGTQGILRRALPHRIHHPGRGSQAR